MCYLLCVCVQKRRMWKLLVARRARREGDNDLLRGGCQCFTLNVEPFMRRESQSKTVPVLGILHGRNGAASGTDDQGCIVDGVDCIVATKTGRAGHLVLAHVFQSFLVASEGLKVARRNLDRTRRRWRLGITIRGRRDSLRSNNRTRKRGVHVVVLCGRRDSV